MRALFERGEPTVYTSERDELKWIGMPIGGAFCGQLYLGGDGRLWRWDIFNRPAAAEWRDSSGGHYAQPAGATAPMEQGFAVRWKDGHRTGVAKLQAGEGWEIEFCGEYPIANVRYTRADVPLELELEAFSPFIPLDLDASSLPATVMRFTLRNTGSKALAVQLTGWMEHMVAASAKNSGRVDYSVTLSRGTQLSVLEHEARNAPPDASPKREPIVFEDFEKPDFEGWEVTGTAFGDGPIESAKMPGYQGDVRAQGARTVNSHNTRRGEDIPAGDRHTGRLVSREFVIERRYISFRIGGGAHAGRTCMNLIVDGAVPRSATGHNDNRMRVDDWNVRTLEGRRARLEIVDAESGGWGNIGVDEIVFCDEPRAGATDVAELPDGGSMTIALLEGVALFNIAGSANEHEQLLVDGIDERSSTWWDYGSDWPGSGDAQWATSDPSRDLSLASCKSGDITTLGRNLDLAPGESRTVTFLLTWYLPNVDRAALGSLPNQDALRRHYAPRFRHATAVARYVASDLECLAAATRAWRDTWYDSTLPFWFLDRVFAPLSTLSTATSLRFQDGRFYGWEGTYCCAGTCTHVWNYAQGLARIFPEIERDQRERVDFGLAFHADTGAIDYRAEAARSVAIDGQAGTILRAYREHTLAPDDAYLRRIWPRVKRALEYLIERDEGRDGILDGPQYNTLDATWWGEISWISSLYLAALRAGEALAREMGDTAFVEVCRAIAGSGSQKLVERLFNGEYFVQRVDPAHREANATGEGCHIDQLFGQSWAHQVGLGRVVPEREAQSALRSLWRYSFAPDVGKYREFAEKTIPGGRWYALPGEAGLLMCTWPRGGIEVARGEGNEAWAAGYFNECMTGFEHQVASHMVAEGLVLEGFAITRAIHDRYHAARRNPYNEVECSDHYARALASYGTFLAACGFEFHGPRAHIGFAPKLTPWRFRAAFTAAEGWGTFDQRFVEGCQRVELELKRGSLRLRTLALEALRVPAPSVANAKLAGVELSPAIRTADRRIELDFDADVVIEAGSSLVVELR